MIYKFTVPGPLMGFKQSSIKIRTRSGKMLHITGSKYVKFRNRVQVLALAEGYRPIATSAKRPATLGLKVFWKGKPKVDFSNVLKSLEDACFIQDRYVCPGEMLMAWDVPGIDGDLAEVTIQVEGE